MLAGVFIGVVIGWAIALLLMLFFENEIFSALETAVEKVRRFFNLPT